MSRRYEQKHLLCYRSNCRYRDSPQTARIILGRFDRELFRANRSLLRYTATTENVLSCARMTSCLLFWNWKGRFVSLIVSNYASEKAWRLDGLLIKGWRRLIQSKGFTHAVDYNCHPDRALASWLHRPRWRQLNSSPARNRRHCLDH